MWAACPNGCSSSCASRCEICSRTRCGRRGLELGLPEEMVWRQPFPGPGLAVRCIGAVSPYRLDILRQADADFREEVARAGLSRELNQYFAVITDMRSVGVMGDGRTYDYTIALRAVSTTDFMTADWARIPLDVPGGRLQPHRQRGKRRQPCGIRHHQ